MIVQGQRRFIIILASVIIIVLTSLIIYSFQKVKSLTFIPLPPRLEEKVSPTPVSDWKTYTNEEYKFSFDYPSSYTLKDFGPSNPRHCKLGKEGCLITENLVIVQLIDPSKIRPPGNTGFVLNISIVNNVTKLNAEETANKYVDYNYGSEPPEILKTSFSNDLSGYHYEEIISGMGHTFWGNYKNNESVIIRINWQKGGDEYNQILSTFKFLNQEPESYIACGCGCCGGIQLTETRCLYKSKGESLAEIIEKDRLANTYDICKVVGCSIGTKYIYCD